MHSHIQEFLESNTTYKASLLEEQQRRSWGYIKAKPRWITDVWCQETEAARFADFAVKLVLHVRVGSGILMGILSMEHMKGPFTIQISTTNVILL